MLSSFRQPRRGGWPPGWDEPFGSSMVGILMNMKAILVGAAVASTVLGVSTASAGSYLANYQAIPVYSDAANVSGIAAQVYGGPGPSGNPAITDWGNNGVGNTVTGDYPTGEFLSLTFFAPASNITVQFDNYGFYNGTTVTAFDTLGNNVWSSKIDTINGWTFGVPGAGIKSLVFDNALGGKYSWEYDIGYVSYTAAPEASTWAMMGLGFASLAFAGYRSRRAATAAP